MSTLANLQGIQPQRTRRTQSQQRSAEVRYYLLLHAPVLPLRALSNSSLRPLRWISFSWFGCGSAALCSRVSPVSYLLGRMFTAEPRREQAQRRRGRGGIRKSCLSALCVRSPPVGQWVHRSLKSSISLGRSTRKSAPHPGGRSRTRPSGDPRKPKTSQTRPWLLPHRTVLPAARSRRKRPCSLQ